MKKYINLSNLIKFVILASLFSQVTHAKDVYRLLSHDTNDVRNEIFAYIFAISVESSIFIFTLKGMKREALFFCIISIMMNILYYWYSIGLTQEFIGSAIISAIIPMTILFYSDLFNVEKEEDVIEEEIEEYRTDHRVIDETVIPLKRKAGRPKGSRNKPK